MFARKTWVRVIGKGGGKPAGGHNDAASARSVAASVSAPPIVSCTQVLNHVVAQAVELENFSA